MRPANEQGRAGLPRRQSTEPVRFEGAAIGVPTITVTEFALTGPLEPSAAFPIGCIGVMT